MSVIEKKYVYWYLFLREKSPLSSLISLCPLALSQPLSNYCSSIRSYDDMLICIIHIWAKFFICTRTQHVIICLFHCGILLLIACTWGSFIFFFVFCLMREHYMLLLSGCRFPQSAHTQQCHTHAQHTYIIDFHSTTTGICTFYRVCVSLAHSCIFTTSYLNVLLFNSHESIIR